MKSKTKEIFISKSPEETREAGCYLAEKITKTKGSQCVGAFIVQLDGNLGAGKTTFMQGVVRYFNKKNKTTSPTFVLMKKFLIKDVFFKTIIHIDAYRLSSFNQLEVLSFDTLLKDPKNIIFIEWMQNIKSKKIKPNAKIVFKHKTIETRKISITL